jgi:hypothetical protein
MASFLSDHNIEVILIDNKSSYQPLLDWYEVCPFKVYRLNENLGHLSFWLSGISETYKDRFYFLTDHDLDLSQIPDDFVDVLFKGLENPKKPLKSGFSLKIDDLPDNTYANQVRDWEYKFWNSVGKNPNHIYDLAEEGWEKYIL